MNTPDTAPVQAKRTLLEEFIYGAKTGFYLGVEKIIPAMIIAYVLILFLKITIHLYKSRIDIHPNRSLM